MKTKIQKHREGLKKLLDKNVKDIILFGPYVKGGNVADIDVAIISQEKNLTEIKKKIRGMFRKETDIQILGLDSIYSPIWLTIIKEGYSIKKNRYLSDIYKTKPKVLFKYSLKKLNNVQKVQFDRALKRTLGNGCERLTRSVVLVPMKMKNEMMDLLKSWNIYYESEEYELLPHLTK